MSEITIFLLSVLISQMTPYLTFILVSKCTHPVSLVLSSQNAHCMLLYIRPTRIETLVNMSTANQNTVPLICGILQIRKFKL